MRLEQIFSGYVLPLSFPKESKSDWVGGVLSCCFLLPRGAEGFSFIVYTLKK